MSFLERKNLYRVETTDICYYAPIINRLSVPMPSFESVKKNGNWGLIPSGTKGWIMEKYGRKYFRPDEEQEGIDLFTPANQPIVLIPYNKICGHYKKICEN